MFLLERGGRCRDPLLLHKVLKVHIVALEVLNHRPTVLCLHLTPMTTSRRILRGLTDHPLPRE